MKGGGLVADGILTPAEISLRLLAAIVASGMIGYERERKGHEAGIRTHALVAVGSCLFALIQLKMAIDLINLTKADPTAAQNLRADMTRVLAQVVSGVGFLGAGTIIINKRRVRGLTTAASIWTTAAIGMGFGLGYYFTMVLSTIIVLVTLMTFKKLFRTPSPLTFEVLYVEQPELSSDIKNFMRGKKVPLLEDHYYYEMKDGIIHHRNHYTIDSSVLASRSEFFDELFYVGEIQEIRSLYIIEEEV